ncbi:MAG: Na/Pi symporter [Bacillota bacterium]
MVVFTNLLLLAGGLGVFLLGMEIISHNLQAVAGDKINGMIGKLSNKKWASVGMGAGAAMLLESSSATTVILLGFVNAGLVSLVQAALIIMGANIGTTITVVIISFNALPIGELIGMMVLVGVIIIISSKKERTKSIGYAVSGLGLIFIGLFIMEDSVEFLKDSPNFVAFIAGLDNELLLLLIGTAFTAIVQSSSATTGIALTLAEAGIMPLSATFAIILGSNLGTCMTAILASMGSTTNGKRTAIIHLLFNAIGVVLYFPLVVIFGDRVANWLLNYFNPSVIIAYFHVFFNVSITILLVPFASKLARVSELLIKMPKTA